VKNTAENKGKMDLRAEARTETSPNSSVEFIPGNTPIAYHFKLKDLSSKGFGIMVRKDSKVLEYIKAGDVLNMRYYPDEATASPVPHQTKIVHISEPDSEKQKDHLLVGLLILELRYKSTMVKDVKADLKLLAVNAARKKAVEMAEVLGAKVGRPLIISEYPIATEYRPMESFARQSSAGIQSRPERIHVSQKIYIRFELTQGKK